MGGSGGAPTMGGSGGAPQAVSGSSSAVSLVVCHFSLGSLSKCTVVYYTLPTWLGCI